MKTLKVTVTLQTSPLKQNGSTERGIVIILRAAAIIVIALQTALWWLERGKDQLSEQNISRAAVTVIKTPHVSTERSIHTSV
jgi:hypothetical protein